MPNGSERKPNRLLRPFAFLGNLGIFIFPIGLVLLMAVPATLIYQAMGWLSTGTWPVLNFADGLAWAGVEAPHFGAASVEQANRLLLQAPLALVLLFGVGIPLFLYAQFSKWLERQCEPEKCEQEPDPA